MGEHILLVEFVVDEAGVTQVLGSGFQQMLARLTRSADPLCACMMPSMHRRRHGPCARQVRVRRRAAVMAAVVACAPTSAVTLPDTPAGTVADSPAVTRLKELLAVVNTGDAAAMRAYLQANSVTA